MDNQGVKCNVCECTHHTGSCGCKLSCIDVTHQKNGTEAIAVPHYCGSFTKK